MGLTVTKMKPKKSYEHVVEQIQSAIFSGELDEGERLPSEMKLKELFDTSRGTVREALRVLEQKGLVSVRTGVKGGARVRAANTHAMEDGMAVLIRHQQVSLDHLAEFRALLEGRAAEQAAQKPSREDLRTLRDILGRIRDHAASGPDNWETFNRLDAQFHQVLAKMGGNPLVEANLKTVHENVHTYFQQYLPFSRALLDRNIRDLTGILAAVEKGDAESAGALARTHVNRFAGLMKQGKDRE